MKEVHELFIDHCYWAYECWQMHELMCDYNVNDPEGIWARMGIIIKEYTVLQIAKINDPAESGEDNNLSLEYFVDHYAPAKTFKRLYETFRTQNRTFIETIRTSRHKSVTHSDLATIKSGVTVGKFPVGEDNNYFDSLHKIIADVLDHKNLGPFPEWPEFIVEDTKKFMHKLQCSCC